MKCNTVHIKPLILWVLTYYQNSAVLKWLSNTNTNWSKQHDKRISIFRSYSCNKLKEWENFTLKGGIAFAFASHWLKTGTAFLSQSPRAAITSTKCLKTALNANSPRKNNNQAFWRASPLFHICFISRRKTKIIIFLCY